MTVEVADDQQFLTATGGLQPSRQLPWHCFVLCFGHRKCSIAVHIRSGPGRVGGLSFSFKAGDKLLAPGNSFTRRLCSDILKRVFEGTRTSWFRYCICDYLEQFDFVYNGFHWPEQQRLAAEALHWQNIQFVYVDVQTAGRMVGLTGFEVIFFRLFSTVCLASGCQDVQASHLQ